MKIKYLLRLAGFASLLAAWGCGYQDMGASYQRGMALYDQGDYKEALALFKPMAEKGYGPARNMMGLAYSRGAGVPMSEDAAIEWFKAGAEQGDGACAFNLAGMYFQGGLSVKRDYKEAAKWYDYAVKRNGSAMAMHNLGVMNERGLGMPKDRAKALALYIRSAEQCYGPALVDLDKFSKEGFKNISSVSRADAISGEADSLARMPLLRERCMKSKAEREAGFQLGASTRN